ncbi:hypothetical protein BV25DRAFT_1065993 [Artomyces pyxidatus]|uniref:Uncharacterized protein n=1 Tax=Artomyces pyxidatus TaxID=48021 RepID=A0ACB8TFF2_9AGAM|nr:hypothetical protein BV25DRAFT_1065993 [Artomyces pyxidatus]
MASTSSSLSRSSLSPIPSPQPSSFTTFIPLSITLYTSTSMAGPVRSNKSTDVKPPRPPNAWILYRSDKLRELPPPRPGEPRRAQSDVSKAISILWRNESEAVRAEYERRAELAKAQHAVMYPNYRFAPVKKADRDRLREEKRLEKERERAEVKKTRQRNMPYTLPAIASQAIHSVLAAPSPDTSDMDSASPPISSASSPTPTTPSSFGAPDAAQHALQHPQPSLDASTSALMLPYASSSTQHPSSRVSSYSTTLPPMSALPQRLRPSPSPAPVTHAWQGSQEASSSTSILPEAASDWSFGDLPTSSSLDQSESVSFQMPLLSMPAMQNFASDQSEGMFFGDSISAMLANTGDPSIYEVQGLDQGLNAMPPGSLDVSVGHIDGQVAQQPNDEYSELFQGFFNEWAPTLDPASAVAQAFDMPTALSFDFSDTTTWLEGSFDNTAPLQVAPQPEPHDTSNFGPESMMGYLNFDQSAPSSHHTSLSMDQQRVVSPPSIGEALQDRPRLSSTATVASDTDEHDSYDAVAASAQPYVPPPGAANAGARRVAGTWKFP